MKSILLSLMWISSSAEAQENIDQWQFRAIIDPMSDANRGIAHTSTANDITMIVKCDRNGDNTIYISFMANEYLGSLSRNRYRPISYRIDGTTVRNIYGIYDDRTASVLSIKPDSDGGRFLKEVSTASKLTVQVTDYDNDPTTAVIDVTGAKRALIKVAETCRDNSMLEFLTR